MIYVGGKKRKEKERFRGNGLENGKVLEKRIEEGGRQGKRRRKKELRNWLRK